MFLISEESFLNKTQTSTKDRGKDKFKYIKINFCILRDINKIQI